MVIDKIEYLHSLDSLELAKIIDKLRDKPLNCFIEVNINEEESKNGVRLEDLDSFISEVIKYQNINIIGLMCMTIKESEDKYQQLTQQIEKTIETQDENQIKEMLKLISTMRKESLAKDGEFGEGNLLFKKLRNDGYIKRLKDVLSDLISKNLSLEMFYISRNYPETVIPTAPEIRDL